MRRRRRRPPRASRAAACKILYRSVFGSARARSPSRASQPEPGQQGGGDQGCGQPGGVNLEIAGREMPDSSVLAGPDAVLDPGMNPVVCVDVGRVGSASQRRVAVAGCRPTGCTASRLRLRTGSAGRPGAAVPGGRTPASFPARRAADPRPGRGAAGRSARDVRFLDPAGAVAAATGRRRRHRSGARGPRRRRRSRSARFPPPGSAASPPSPAGPAPSRPSRSAGGRAGLLACPGT